MGVAPADAPDALCVHLGERDYGAYDAALVALRGVSQTTVRPVAAPQTPEKASRYAKASLPPPVQSYNLALRFSRIFYSPRPLLSIMVDLEREHGGSGGVTVRPDSRFRSIWE